MIRFLYLSLLMSLILFFSCDSSSPTAPEDPPEPSTVQVASMTVGGLSSNFNTSSSAQRIFKENLASSLGRAIDPTRIHIANIISDAGNFIIDIYIDDSPGLNIMELRAKARQMKLDKNIDLIIVDYLQLLHKEGRVESRQQEISYISRSLKSLAKELNVPVIALSQLSRAPESRSDHRPIMSDLRESGAIEQDADIVLFIFRKYIYSKDPEDKGIAELIISKHRNGPTGIVKLSFIDEYAKFQNYDFIHDGDFSRDDDLSDAIFE